MKKLFSVLWFYGALGLGVSHAEAQELAKSGPVAEQSAKQPFSVTVTGKGEPMIFIPGLSCSGNVWHGTVEHFKDRYECHVLTLAGFAGQPALGGDGPMLETIRDGIGRYIREKGLQKPVIVGHSLGAFMAFWLGATFPGEVGPLVAVDGMPFFPALQNPKATSESVKKIAKGVRSSFEGQTPQQFAFSLRLFLRGMVTDNKAFEKVAEDSDRSDPKAIARAMYELMTVDLRPAVASIQVPVLVVGATALNTDAKQRSQAEENYRKQVETIPDHRMIFAPKARHFIQLDEPDFLFGEMDLFLKKAGRP